MYHLNLKKMEEKTRNSFKLGDIVKLSIRSGELKECVVTGIYSHLIAVKYLSQTGKVWLSESFQLKELYLRNIGGIRTNEDHSNI